MGKSKASGFTLKELAAILAMLPIFLTLLWSGCNPLTGVREKGRQTSCTANLRNGVSIGLAQYASLSGTASGMFPIIDSNQFDPMAPLSSATTWSDSNIPAVDANFTERAAFAHGINAMQNIWLMVRAGCIQEASFRCPSDEDWEGREVIASGTPTGRQALKYGWTSPRQFSYGLQWPYSSGPGGQLNNSAPTSSGLDDGVAIAADQNPGGAVGTTAGGQKIWHSNHPDDGAAVLYKSGQAKFYKAEQNSLAGFKNDDIYVNNQGRIQMPTFKTQGDGSDYFDTVITPGYEGKKASTGGQ